MPLYLTFALAFCGFINMSAGRVVLSLYALDLGAQAYTVGVVVAMFYIFPLLLSWPVGALSDRFGSRWLLVIGSFAGACGMLVPYFIREMSALYIAAAMCGLSLAFFNVIVQNLVGILSKPHERTRTFSNFSMVGAGTNFVGPMIAGFSVDYAGPAAACVFIVVPSLAAAMLLALWGNILPGGSRHTTPSASALDTLKDAALWRMLAVSSLVQLGNDLFQFYIPIYGHDIGLSASAIGMVIAAFAAAAFIVRFGLPRLVARFTEAKLLGYSLYIAAVGFFLAPFSGSAVVLALIAFLFGLGMGCGQPLVLMLMFSRSPPGRSGATLGLRLTVNNLMRAIGPPAFGLIGTAFGLLSVFWINAVMMCAGGVLSRPRKIR